MLQHPVQSIVTRASKLGLRKKYFWTAQRIARLEQLFPDLFLRELACFFPVSQGSISQKAKELGLEKSDRYRVRFHNKMLETQAIGRASRNCHVWTKREIGLLRKLWPNTSARDLRKIFKLSMPQIYSEARRLKLEKDPEFLKDVGRRQANNPKMIANRFKKGQTSHNKGKKGIYPPGCEKGWFGKGHQPVNTLFDGAVTIRTDKDTGRAYKWVRTSKAKWMMLHVQVWEAVHGKVPPGHIVVFTNGDSMNCAIENLRMITNRQHAEETRQKDAFIVTTMTRLPKRGGYDRALASELLKHPELIDARRKQLQLNKLLKEKGHE